MNRDYSYDYLRAFAAIMIVLCHICQGFGLSAELGYYLGGTYVDVFLLLSAYLLGVKYRDKIGDNPVGFLRKRTSRLIPTYYIYLAIVILLSLILFGGNAFTWKQTVGHFLFLNWFWYDARIFESPLPQLGHLWFMSAILMGYVCVALYGMIIKKSRLIRSNGFWIVFLISAACISSLLTSKIRMMVYPCTASFLFILIFYKGKEIMIYIRKMPAPIMISLLIISNLGGGNLLSVRGL
ncbi:MAG: acyltransferase family protein [Muribaculum sp.]|nr:acyltransferase family protein [Muribaculum sp.]